jgi:hypothetical protein
LARDEFPPCETSPAARCIGVFLLLKCNLAARSQRLKLNLSKGNFFSAPALELKLHALALNDRGAVNQVTPAITAFDRPWSAFVFICAGLPFCCASGSSQTDTKSTSSNLQKPSVGLSAAAAECGAKVVLLSARVGVICAARKLMLFMQRSAAGLTQNGMRMRMPPMGVVLLWLMEDAT